jgi:hypothetical protein
MTSTRQIMRQVSRVVDGKEATVDVSMPIQVTERRESSHTVTYPATAITGITVDEKPLDDRHRTALKSREIPVVVATNGRGVDAFWLQNVKPNMLVLTVPTVQAPSPQALERPVLMAPPMAPGRLIAPSAPMIVPMPLPPAPVVPRE